MRYAIVIEQAGAGYSAYAPDLPGCIAAGSSIPEVEGLMHEVIDFHLAGMKAGGLSVPQAVRNVEYMEVAA